jgi:hypothetical protein
MCELADNERAQYWGIKTYNGAVICIANEHNHVQPLSNPPGTDNEKDSLEGLIEGQREVAHFLLSSRGQTQTQPGPNKAAGRHYRFI